MVTVCVNVVFAGQPKPKKVDNRHEIEQLEEAWRNAALKSDTNAMSALLADDYIAITASGTLQTKEEALPASGPAGFASLLSMSPTANCASMGRQRSLLRRQTLGP